MRIQAIISDLDGTILPRGGAISSATYTSFQKAGEHGCLRIIATGRNLYSARQVLPPDFPIDYLIFSSGAGILRWRDQELLFTHHLQEMENRKIADYLWDFHINFTIQKEMPENQQFYYTNLYPLHDDFKRRIETYAPFGELLSSPEQIKGQATQFIVILEATQLHLLEKIRKELSEFSIVRSTSPLDLKAIWMEIFAANINKGSTVLRLLQQLQITPDRCAGLGNDYNDLDFLNVCGSSFLVANAPRNLHPHYKLVKKDNEEGFTEFIDKILSPFY